MKLSHEIIALRTTHPFVIARGGSSEYRVVRVTADSLTRLLALAGESGVTSDPSSCKITGSKISKQNETRLTPILRRAL